MDPVTRPLSELQAGLAVNIFRSPTENNDMRNSILLIALVFAMPCGAQDDIATRESIMQSYDQDLTKLKKIYSDEISKIESAYHLKLAERISSAKSQLEELQKSVATSDLDEAIRIRDAARGLNAEEKQPAQPNASGDDSKLKFVSDLRRELIEKDHKIAELEQELTVAKGFGLAVYGHVSADVRKIHILFSNGHSVFFAGNRLDAVGYWKNIGDSFEYTWKGMAGTSSGSSKAKIDLNGAIYTDSVTGNQCPLIFGDPSIVTK